MERRHLACQRSSEAANAFDAAYFQFKYKNICFDLPFIAIARTAASRTPALR